MDKGEAAQTVVCIYIKLASHYLTPNRISTLSLPFKTFFYSKNFYWWINNPHGENCIHFIIGNIILKVKLISMDKQLLSGERCTFHECWQTALQIPIGSFF